MNAWAHYRHLISLGREEFLAAAAPAALVRFRVPKPPPDDRDRTRLISQHAGDETMPIVTPLATELEMQIYPLVKKPNASFPDRITIGRISNNDLVIEDASVSRLHAYVRHLATDWVVADAGSKNGSWLRGDILEARRERPLTSQMVLRLGDFDLTFYLAPDLFAVLVGEA